MSLSSVRQYFRDRLDPLGFEEHTDGFNFDNVAQTISEGVYILEVGNIDGSRANQLTHEFIYPLTIRIIFFGANDPRSTIDRAILASEDILASVLSPANRLGIEIKDVFPGTITVEPRSESNDNDVILVMSFNADIICDFS